jgi:hypothetical protein
MLYRDRASLSRSGERDSFSKAGIHAEFSLDDVVKAQIAAKWRSKCIRR